jgi:phosphoesterase RecJ-like protein
LISLYQLRPDNFPIFGILKTVAKVLNISKLSTELFNLFSTSRKILIICHINPDGDAIGSQLALYHYLKAKKIDAEMLSPNNIQEFLKWMEGSGNINIYIRNQRKYKKLINEADLIIMVDFNHSDRLGEAEKPVLHSSAKKVIIDHHLDPESFADLTISDPSKCSTSELLNSLISEINGSQFLNKPFAEAIYTGIITDTGNFEYGNYAGDTLRTVAKLLDYGVEKDRIYNLIYKNFSSDRLKLQGFVLNEKMVVLPELRTAYISLTREELLSHNYTIGDTEGFVNLPLAIRGIDFSALLIEKKDFIKLSFRSRGDFPVNDFATKYFSGGGHMNASGGEFTGTLEDAISYFLKTVKEIRS